MELLGAILMVAALALVVAWFIARPFLSTDTHSPTAALSNNAAEALEHRRSSLLAERDRMLVALQDLEFDHTLGKIPAEDYPRQRLELLQNGAAILRKLDEMQPDVQPLGAAEDRIEAVVAARRADARGGNSAAVVPGKEKDPLEDLIAARRRAREEKSGGFCPKCGQPILVSDKFCSRCGTVVV